MFLHRLLFGDFQMTLEDQKRFAYAAADEAAQYQTPEERADARAALDKRFSPAMPWDGVHTPECAENEDGEPCGCAK